MTTDKPAAIRPLAAAAGKQNRTVVQPAAIVTVVLAVLAMGVSPAAAQSDNKTLKVVYAYGAGNSGDALSRLIADRLGAHLKVPAVVENMAGASGRMGTRAVINAAPDGFTLLSSPMAPVALHPVTYSNLPYDPFKDLAPVSQIATFDIALAVAGKHPAKSVATLVPWLKSDPANGAYGTPGLGGLPHFFAVMFADQRRPHAARRSLSRIRAGTQ